MDIINRVGIILLWSSPILLLIALVMYFRTRRRRRIIDIKHEISILREESGCPHARTMYEKIMKDCIFHGIIGPDVGLKNLEQLYDIALNSLERHIVGQQDLHDHLAISPETEKSSSEHIRVLKEVYEHFAQKSPVHRA